VTSSQPDYAPPSEREALTVFLDLQRDILVRKIEGVTDDDARSAPTASALSYSSLDARCALPGMEDRNLRWVLLHHIEEVARHAGHADIIRETIDGGIG
jgi:Protein of unknown function (DUF664)